MLHLRRIVSPYEWERDHITGDYITFGEFYYYDDDDGLVVSKKTYDKFKDQKRRETWDYSRLENAQSQREYEEILKQKERDFLADTLLERQVEKRS